MKTKSFLAFASALVALICCASARAGFTPIIDNAKEPNQQAIFQQLFGGTVVTDGLNYANGTITATRINDDDDQTFPGHEYRATVVARFSDHSQSFGTIQVGNFVKSFDVSGQHFDVSGSDVVDLAHGITVGRSGDTGMDSSIVADNPDKRDHLITYQITGEGTAPQYMLFWDDLNLLPGPPHGSLADFNDVVVELQGVKGQNVGSVAPLPPAIFTGAALIVSIALLRFPRLKWT